MEGIRTRHLIKPAEKFHHRDGKKLMSTRVNQHLAEFCPQTVILIVRDNDIDWDSDPEAVASYILATASALKRRHAIENMVISLILPRHCTRHNANVIRRYNILADEINSLIIDGAMTAGIVVIHQHTFNFPQYLSRNEVSQDKADCVTDGVDLQEVSGEHT